MNNLQVRDTNKKRVINYLYKNNAAAKQDIISTLGLSMPTVSHILKELSDRGLVKKVGTLQSSGGRKPAAISLVYDAKLSVGVEIKSRHLLFSAIDLGENILYSKKIRFPFHNDNDYYRMFAAEIEKFIDESGIDTNKLLGVGIAVPGIVNIRNNILEYSPTLNVTNLPLETLAKFIPYTVMSGNEANLAGFSEVWKMDNIEDAVFLSINKGVGGAIFIGNKLYYGKDGRSGEFGHMTIVKDGQVCSCGKRGCLEAYCSSKVLIEPDYDDIDEFFADLEANNENCQKKWHTYLDYLATGINNIYTQFNSNIIIGGEVSTYLKKYCETLQQMIISRSTFETNADYLHFSQFGDHASSVGAALLLVDEFLSE
ncbi:hypothetical protein CCDG5_1876 [[Clostridium] cellulosi]|uniref:ROK family protein n=1 Tax=[Clostridium] cellulosi TaxID=29343 RepID=A0A078KRF2_9FIRM|nr:MAG: ROK family transcriptional regulator [[Clostridium] cellulosi]CDZ24973.1 hypothetical protein CCDG5_1876 [[Clostridium] cellulosi]